MAKLSQKTALVASLFSWNRVKSDVEKAPVVGTSRSPFMGAEYRYATVMSARCQSSFKVGRSLPVKRPKTQVRATLTPCAPGLGAVFAV